MVGYLLYDAPATCKYCKRVGPVRQVGRQAYLRTYPPDPTGQPRYIGARYVRTSKDTRPCCPESRPPTPDPRPPTPDPRPPTPDPRPPTPDPRPPTSDPRRPPTPDPRPPTPDLRPPTSPDPRPPTPDPRPPTPDPRPPTPDPRPPTPHPRPPTPDPGTGPAALDPGTRSRTCIRTGTVIRRTVVRGRKKMSGRAVLGNTAARPKAERLYSQYSPTTNLFPTEKHSR